METKRNLIELKIDDPAFALLKIQIDNLLKDTIMKMADRSCDEGAVSIKISLKTEEANLPITHDLVDKLSVDWKLTGQIVEKKQADGNIYDAHEYYLDWDDPKNPTMRLIKDAQHSIDEYM